VIGSQLVQSIVERHRSQGGTRLGLLRDVASVIYEVPTIALTTGYWSGAVRCCWGGTGSVADATEGGS
jgi:hypothetical protein